MEQPSFVDHPSHINISSPNCFIVNKFLQSLFLTYFLIKSKLRADLPLDRSFNIFLLLLRALILTHWRRYDTQWSVSFFLKKQTSANLQLFFFKSSPLHALEYLNSLTRLQHQAISNLFDYVPLPINIFHCFNQLEIQQCTRAIFTHGMCEADISLLRTIPL